MDGFQPEGLTKLAQDSVFMMPHLGVLSTVHPQAALEIFEKDCLVRLGTCIAPKGVMRKSENALGFRIEDQKGGVVDGNVPFGTIRVVPLDVQSTGKLLLTPSKELDVGKGAGHQLEASVEGGVVGLIFDCRGRPLQIPEDPAVRRGKLLEWFQAMNVYPETVYERIRDGEVKGAN